MPLFVFGWQFIIVVNYRQHELGLDHRWGNHWRFRPMRCRLDWLIVCLLNLIALPLIIWAWTCLALCSGSSMVAPAPIMGLPIGGAGESFHRCSPLPSPSVPTQPSSFEVGESLGDEKCHKLLKHYHKVRALLCVSRLHADMLLSDLVPARIALVA
jgi:hypothetical protein